MKSTVLNISFLVLLLTGYGLAQQPVNNAQEAGTATLTGNGVTGAGSQRVTIASDNTAFAVNATLSAETSKVIGTVNQGTSPWVNNTSQINGVTVLMGNGTTGTGSQRVTIASDNTAFSVNATLSAETTKVIGTVRVLGNSGAVVDFAGQNAAAPANALLTGGTFFTTPTTLTNGDASPLQLDNSGKLLVNCTGCSAGSTVSLIPATTGGLLHTHFVAAASDNATNLKGSAGQVYTVDVYNAAAYPVYLKLYNKATSPTSCGATSLFKVVGIQAGTQKTLSSEQGYAMGTGIGYCLTKGITDADDTAVLISDATVDIGYK